MMKKVAGTLLLVSLFAAVVIPRTKRPAPELSAAESAVRQLEHEWASARVAGDMDKLNQIIADDWVGLNFHGNKSTKQNFLDSVKSKATIMTSYDFGPMDVLVSGDMAAVQSSVTATGTRQGSPVGGSYVFMDVFAQRDGRWQVVRSVTAKVQ